MQVVAQANAEEAARLREALADAVLARDEAHRQAESARQDLQRHSRAAAAQPAAAGTAASGSGGGANGARLARELQELQVRFNERSAELGLLQVRGLYSYLLSPRSYCRNQRAEGICGRRRRRSCSDLWPT